MSSGNARKFSMAVLAVIASSAAQAQEPGWYLGGNVGRATARIDDNGIKGSLLGAGFTGTAIGDHDHDTAFKVFGGYRFTEYFALEGGYFNLGHFGYDATTVPGGTLDGRLGYQGANLDAVGFLPLGGHFSLFGRAGVTYGQTRDTFSGTGLVTVLTPDPSHNGVGAKFGGGLQYELTRRVAVRAEVERYLINDAVGNRGDLDMASLGILVRFGRHAPAPAAQAPAPEPAPALMPVAVAAAEPAPPATTLYCSVLDIGFDIDKDDLQLEDKEKLKVVGIFMAKYPATTAVIHGHSDNVGTPAHNLELSRRRAESVVNNLMDNFHISAARLTAVGDGVADPLGDNATEAGKRENRRIDAVISCATDVEGLPVAPARLTMGLLIEFDADQAEVKPQYDAELAKVARYLKDHPGVTATVEGHTGKLRGTPEHGQLVSEQRARNVVAYLVTNLGVAPARLTAVGFGKGRRFAYNTTLESQQENRRVNVIFTYPK